MPTSVVVSLRLLMLFTQCWRRHCRPQAFHMILWRQIWCKEGPVEPISRLQRTILFIHYWHVPQSDGDVGFGWVLSLFDSAWDIRSKFHISHREFVVITCQLPHRSQELQITLLYRCKVIIPPPRSKRLIPRTSDSSYFLWIGNRGTRTLSHSSRSSSSCIKSHRMYRENIYKCLHAVHSFPGLVKIDQRTEKSEPQVWSRMWMGASCRLSATVTLNSTHTRNYPNGAFHIEKYVTLRLCRGYLEWAQL